MKTPLDPNDVSIRVNSGMEFIKKYYTEEQIKNINIDILELNSPFNCVLSQLGNGIYHIVVEELQNTKDVLHTHLEKYNNGFCRSEYSEHIDEEFELLNREWKRRLIEYQLEN